VVATVGCADIGQCRGLAVHRRRHHLVAARARLAFPGATKGSKSSLMDR
jgi:hypothetical protein